MAQDVVERSGEGDKGRALGFGRHRETGVVAGQINLAQERVGLGHRGDGGQAQFLRQAILQCREHALRAPPGLGGVGRDQFDAQLAQGSAHLGRVVLVHLAAGLGRVPVVRGPVGVERAEQPPDLDHLAQGPEAAHGPLFVDEEGRVDLAGCVIHGDDQVPPLPGNPLVGRAVLVQHHGGQGAARPLAPVRASPRCRTFAPVGLERQADPVVAPREAVLIEQLLVEVLGREVPVARVEQLQNLHHRVHRHPVPRDLAQPAVIQTLRAFRLKATPPAPERSLAHPQDRRRLRLAQSPPLRALQNLLELHLP